nr:MAG TPA: hypothetical protein [Caudoviricetes sp.]
MYFTLSPPLNIFLEVFEGVFFVCADCFENARA